MTGGLQNLMGNCRPSVGVRERHGDEHVGRVFACHAAQTVVFQAIKI